MAVSSPALTPISMEEAVGYPSVDCAHQGTADDALVLKHDRLFLLLDGRGCIAPPGRCGLGLFQDDTRILSHYAVRFTGGEPALLSAQVPAPYHAVLDLAVSDRDYGGDSWDPTNVIHIRRELVLDDRLHEQVTLTNHLTRAVDFEVELLVACDFADIFEVRGWRREARGQFYAPATTPRTIRFAYRGVDGALLSSRVVTDGEPDEIGAAAARWRLRLEPANRRLLRWEVVGGEPQTGAATPAARAEAGADPRGATGSGPGSAAASRAKRPERTPRAAATVVGRARTRLADAYDDWRSGCSRWHSDEAGFNTTLGRAIDDLRALYLRTEGGDIVSAGIPWFSAAFGRDSIITSLQTLPVNPSIAVDTLRFLARHQGWKEDPYTEEQPGRILHELRRGELARSGEIPHVPYYGTIDATPLWLVLLHETWRWTGDDGLAAELLPHADRALEWIERFGDVDADGFVEYARTSDRGLVNQGWKDSGDGVPFPDGRLPDPPIALVEVQGYVHDARLRMAHLYEAMGRSERARELRAQAYAVRRRIRDAFWLEDVGCFALALDGSKRPLPTVTSNAGHLLWSRVPSGEQARRMADVLTGQAMFSGWGIRTLSAEHPVYNPMSYHNGSVWPHDNALIVFGLGLYDLAPRALPVVTALHEAASHMRQQRLPELFCGIRRAGGRAPVLYPVSCSPQAWASGAIFMLLQGVLGILPDAPAGVLHIREPHLPPFLRELTVDRLRVGRSQVALQFRRHGRRTLVNLLGLEGDPLQVRIELS